MSADHSTNETIASGLEATDVVDLHAYWRTIARRRWIVVSFFVAAVLATAIVTLRQPKIYGATCTIIIDVAAPRVLEKEQVQEVVESGSGASWYNREYYETQYRVITSRTVAQRVADKLQLAANPRFLGLTAIPEAEREAARLGRDPVAIVQANLKVEPVKDSRVVRIRYEDRDPEMAAIVANTVAEAYIAETLSVRTTTTASASDWLEQQLADLERKLEASGKALYDFKKSHDIVAASWDDRQSIISQQLVAISTALTNARLKKAELQARNEEIEALGKDVKAGVDAESVHPVVANGAIQALKAKYLDTRQECTGMRDRYLEDHPKLAECDKRLGLTKQAFDEQVKIAIEAARKDYREVTASERNLAKLLEQAKAEAFGLNQYERDYLELKRAHDNNQRLYELVLKRLKDTGVAGMLQASNVRILDRARPSMVPVRPSTSRNLLLAIFAGVVGGIALAFVFEYLDQSVTTQAQIEQQLGLTFLGIYPSVERKGDGQAQDLFVHTSPKSAVAECVRAIRTNLLFMSPDRPLKTILVTSSGPQEGKTTTATSLAITMAGSGNRVLLIDADMRRPRIHKVFGMSNGKGLSSLILGEGQLKDHIRETEVAGLYALTCGPVPPNPAELLHTAAFQKILGLVTDRFDRVIIDSPPVGVVADAAVMSTHVDGTVVVVKAGQTSREAGRKAVRQLRDVKANLLGAVLNDLDLQRYGQYAYYYQYGYYYGEPGRDEKRQSATDIA